MKTELKGIMPAVASPCDENDAFLEEKFAALVESLCGAGVHGVYVCGMTGDGYSMRLGERKRAAEIAVDVSRKSRAAVIVHVGTTNTRDAAELAAHAAGAGADAVSSIPPAAFSHKQLLSYYTDIARAAQIPVLVYHVPALTHSNPTVEEIFELLDVEGVVGLKYTDWNLFFMKRLLLARPETIVFNGYDELFCPALLYGATGGIGTSYNLFPRLYLGIYSAIQQGDVQRAMNSQERFLAFADLLWKVGVKPLFEYLMRQRGLAPYCFRRPRAALDKELLARIEPELNARIAAIEELRE